MRNFLTQIFFKGGIAQNIVPAEFKALFDLRISKNTEPKEFEDMIIKMLSEAEEGETDSGRITYDLKFVRIIS